MNPKLKIVEVEAKPALHSYVDHLRYKGWSRPPVLHTRKVAGEAIIGSLGLIQV